ncbi:hypothetical protein HRbin36_02459 [bacterium HR36]|nr:hypothetical protein HRbin36_02459 [bacterium HR36]
MNGRQIGSQLHAQVISEGYQQTPDRGESLRVAKHRLALPGMGKELGEPGDRRHKLHAHPDKRCATQYQQHPRRSAETGSQRRKRIQQNAPDQHAPPTQQIRQIPSQKSENASRKGAAPHDIARPAQNRGVARGRVGVHVQQLGQGGAGDERHHEQLIDVESEADRGDADD